MTISTTASQIAYTGNGATTVFPVPFVFFDATDLQVIQRNITTGAETTLAISTDYTVSGGGGSSGTVTAVVAPPSSVTWTIRRATAATQLVDLPANGPFPADTVERALDRATAVVQEIRQDVGRALLVPVTDSSVINLPSAVARAGQVLGFDVSGNPRAVTPAEIQAGFGYSPATVFAAPIGTGAGVVPAAIAERFRNVANGKTDFGIQLYEADGFTLRDNTSRIQAAIDAIQPYGGALFLERVDGNQYLLTGPLTLRSTGTSERRNFSLIGEQDYDGTRGLRDSFVGAPTQYTAGTVLKLKAGSTGPLITAPPNSGMLNIERMGFDGNRTEQTAPRRVIEWQDAPGGYSFCGTLEKVSVTNSAAEGIFVGVNRAMALFIDTWVQYCGTDGGAPAFHIRSYDVQIERIGIGNCPGLGMYVGGSAQFEMCGGAIWNCKSALTIATDTLTAYVSGVHFDASSEAQVTVNAYTADSRLSIRHFINCMFSRRDVGASGTVPYADGFADDIVSAAQNLALTGCQFAGKASGTGNRRSRYNLNMNDANARTLVVGENAVSNVANTLGFTNDWNRIRRGTSSSDNTYYIPGTILNIPQAIFGGIQMQASDGTNVAALTSGAAGAKEGSLRLWTAAGVNDLILGAGTGIGRSKIGLSVAPDYANDAGAAAGGLAVGDLYFNTTIDAYTKRQV